MYLVLINSTLESQPFYRIIFDALIFHSEIAARQSNLLAYLVVDSDSLIFVTPENWNNSDLQEQHARILNCETSSLVADLIMPAVIVLSDRQG